MHAVQAEGRATLTVRVIRTLFGVAGGIGVLDLLTKIWAVETLSNRSNIKVVGEFFQLTLVRNPGAAFSFAENATIFLSLFAIVVAVVIVYYSRVVTSQGWALVMGLILGGIIGNLSDRIFREPGFLRGHVIDWLQLPNWPIFNIADSAIVVAALISAILLARNIPPISKVESST